MNSKYKSLNRIKGLVRAKNQYLHVAAPYSSLSGNRLKSKKVGFRRVWIDLQKVSKTSVPCESARPILHNVNLSFHGGESVLILGKPGSGKSLLGQLIAGVSIPTSGKIFFGRRAWPHNPLWRDRPNYVWPVQMIRQAPFRPLHCVGRIETYIKGVIRRILDSCGHCELYTLEECVFLVGWASDHLSLPLRVLNRVECIQLMIAEKIVCRPRVLVLDDIFEGLTADEIRHLQMILYNLQRLTGMTIILLSSSWESIFMPVDRIVVLDNGTIRAFNREEDIDSWVQEYKAFLTENVHWRAARRSVCGGEVSGPDVAA